MRHARSLGFDDLEGRKLLRKLAHHPAVSGTHAAVFAASPVPQIGTGAYARGSETGSIQVTLNPSKGVAETMTFVTSIPQ